MNHTYTLLIDTINSLPGIEITSHILDQDYLYIKDGWNGLLLFFHVDQSDSEGLFFITRCLDDRYFEHGHKWRIELSVGDRKYDNGDRPITYHIFRPILDGDTEESLINECNDLIKNMSYHFNHDGFMVGFNMDKDRYKKSRLHYTNEAWDREMKIKELGI